MNKTRKLVYVAVFGSLWGISEIFLGSFLAALHIPMYGALMAIIGVLITLSGVLFVQERGALLSMGIVTAFLKLFSIGAIFLSPMLAIVVEAALGEAVVSVFGRNRPSFALAGAVMVGYCFLHRFISQTIFFGRDIIDVYVEYIRLGAEIFGIPGDYAFAILGLFLLMHLLLGAIAGLSAWRIGRQAKKRMGIA